MTSRAYGGRSPRSRCDVVLVTMSRAPGARSPVLIMTSFATELATFTVTDVRTDTLPRL